MTVGVVPTILSFSAQDEVGWISALSRFREQ